MRKRSGCFWSSPERKNGEVIISHWHHQAVHTLGLLFIQLISARAPPFFLFSLLENESLGARRLLLLLDTSGVMTHLFHAPWMFVPLYCCQKGPPIQWIWPNCLQLATHPQTCVYTHVCAWEVLFARSIERVPSTRCTNHPPAVQFALIYSFIAQNHWLSLFDIQ